MSECLHWTCTSPVQSPLTWSSLPFEEFLRHSSSVLSFMKVAQAVVLKSMFSLLIHIRK